MSVEAKLLDTVIRNVAAHFGASPLETQLAYDHFRFPDSWLTTSDTSTTHVISLDTLDVDSPDVNIAISVTTLNGVVDQVLQLGHNAAGNGRADTTKPGWWLQMEYKFKTGPGGGDPTESEAFYQWTSADGLTVRRPISCNVDWADGACTWGVRGEGGWENSAGTQHWRFDEATGLVDINTATGGIRKLGNNTGILFGQETAGAGASLLEIVRIGTDNHVYIDANQAWVGFSVNAPITSLNPGGVPRFVVDTASATASVPLGVPSHVVASLPSAATAGRIIYVSNETGGAVLAFSDGTNWRRVTDRAIVA